MLPHFFQLIGSDRCLTPAEVAQANEPHPLIQAAWDVYREHFQEFTGATLDPLFHRLSHPAVHAGSLHVDAGTAVVVAGTGPSLAPNVAALKRLRGRIRIFTSPRGAEVLLSEGIVPDLVLVEHQTALDAHHSTRHLNDCTREVLTACPLIAADWRTPTELLAGVAQEALFVPAPLPTWGLWPATAVAMAVEAGATRVSLLGIDLGTAAEPDPSHAPLSAVLALLGRLAPIVAFDCGTGGAPKRHWLKASIDEAAGSAVSGPCEVKRHAAPSRAERLREASLQLRAHVELVGRARALLAIAGDARDRRAVAESTLREAAAEIMQWRHDTAVRLFAQEGLGLAFLPRLWRIGIDEALGHALWRPLMLAIHELVRQADALAAVNMARAA